MPISDGKLSKVSEEDYMPDFGAMRGESRTEVGGGFSFSAKVNATLKKKDNFDNEDLDYLKRDPEEEFFMLSVLALKMCHTEEFQAEYVYDVQAS